MKSYSMYLSRQIDKRGFSLIELMVVSIVVGILIAIVLPALGRAREGARKSACANNLRQLGIAFHMYIDDNDYKFPSLNDPDYWFNIIREYIDDKDALKCPTYKDHITGYEQAQSFGMNQYLDKEDLNDVISPGQCMLLTDTEITDPVPQVITGYGAYGAVVQTTYYISYVRIPGDRHFGGPNIVFVDGHVGWCLKNAIPIAANSPNSTLWWNTPYTEEPPSQPPPR